MDRLYQLKLLKLNTIHQLILYHCELDHLLAIPMSAISKTLTSWNELGHFVYKSATFSIILTAGYMSNASLPLEL